jgi:hypothetical protein|eukprot:gnl/Ergobibamus_cyprinoides/1883.p1 GENE.gnl/Ergobibamus_cyprinoides/1883~~gnl/Ergobibamus_cyprinoides/1883.p1  ORF type:complete len:218 (+),score=45.25 gnl/Ergobibamus_cyprinoides/1883:115-768(+)
MEPLSSSFPRSLDQGQSPSAYADDGDSELAEEERMAVLEAKRDLAVAVREAEWRARQTTSILRDLDLAAAEAAERQERIQMGEQVRRHELLDAKRKQRAASRRAAAVAETRVVAQHARDREAQDVENLRALRLKADAARAANEKARVTEASRAARRAQLLTRTAEAAEAARQQTDLDAKRAAKANERAEAAKLQDAAWLAEFKARAAGDLSSAMLKL